MDDYDVAVTSARIGSHVALRLAMPLCRFSCTTRNVRTLAFQSRRDFGYEPGVTPGNTPGRHAQNIRTPVGCRN